MIDHTGHNFRISISAFFSSDEADFEKSASAIVEINETTSLADICERLIGLASAPLADSPFSNVQMMNAEEAENYLAEQEAADGDES